MNPYAWTCIGITTAVVALALAWRPATNWAARRLENLIADALDSDPWPDYDDELRTLTDGHA